MSIRNFLHLSVMHKTILSSLRIQTISCTLETGGFSNRIFHTRPPSQSHHEPEQNPAILLFPLTADPVTCPSVEFTFPVLGGVKCHSSPH